MKEVENLFFHPDSTTFYAREVSSSCSSVVTNRVECVSKLHTRSLKEHKGLAELKRILTNQGRFQAACLLRIDRLIQNDQTSRLTLHTTTLIELYSAVIDLFGRSSCGIRDLKSFYIM